MKYWGKTNAALNVPAVGSISVTLADLWSETAVEFDEALERDSFSLDGHDDPSTLERVTRCLDLLRARSGVAKRARIVTRNNFPTGAGLASSASGFAALTAAAAAALELDLTPTELSTYARQGSGSAARSIFGGYVEMHAGSASDGTDSFAEPLLAPDAWPLKVVIALTSREPKQTSSSVGMRASTATSPYFVAWVTASRADLEAARRAIQTRDFAALAHVAEHSCLKFHGLAMSSRPSLIYWKPATIACIETVREMQRAGHDVFFTIDAGPQVKAFCTPQCAKAISTALRDVPGVIDVIATGLGAGVETQV